jgi:hypothetical protein
MIRRSKLTLYFIGSSPGVSHFPRNFWFILLDNQHLGSRWTSNYWGIAAPRLSVTEPGNMSTCICTHTYLFNFSYLLSHLDCN